MRGIVFFDRDGTLIEEVGYLSDPARVREIPGAAESLRRLSEGGMLLAVVSNQAGLAKGRFGEEQMKAVDRAFRELFRRWGVEFDAVEYCPHHIEGTVDRYREACECRKPGTGLADRILSRLGVPPSCPRWVVGDKMTDILMGRGLRAATVLVGTGYGTEEYAAMRREGILPDAYVPSVREAAAWILPEREDDD